MTAEGGGRTAEGVVKDGYYTCQLFLPGTLGTLVRTRVSMYDSAGKLVERR